VVGARIFLETPRSLLEILMLRAVGGEKAADRRSVSDAGVLKANGLTLGQ
jgi:hypothetical protein